MTDFELAGGTRIIKADDIYECIACSKMYTQEEMHAHEQVCAKIPAYLEWLKTQ
jgi:hypothetical protein